MKLFVFGLGYAAQYIARRLQDAGTAITATVRSTDKADMLTSSGVTAKVFSPESFDPSIVEDIVASDAVLVSIPPDATGDPVLAKFAEALAAA